MIDFSALEGKVEYARSQIQNAEELVSMLFCCTLTFMTVLCFELCLVCGSVTKLNPHTKH